MIPRVKITAAAYQRIEDANGAHTGSFYGIMFSGKLCIVGINFHSLTLSAPPYQCFYPAGIDWCGIFKITSHRMTDTDRKDALKMLKEVQVTSNPVFIFRNTVHDSIKVYVVSNDTLIVFEDTEIIEEEEFRNRFLYIQLRSQIKLVVNSLRIDSITESLNSLKTELASNEPIFQFKDTNTFLHSSTMDSLPSDITLDNLNKLKEEFNNKSEFGEIQGITQIRMLLSKSTAEQITHTLQENIEDKGCKYIIKLPVDALCVAEKRRSIQESYGIFMDSIWRWVENIQFYFSTMNVEKKSMLPFKIYHFFPKILGHYVTVFYHTESDEKELMRHRNYLHSSFNISHSRPFFKAEIAVNIKNRTSNILMNVHNGLRIPNVTDGKISVIDGDYDYYHYLLDSFNDKGWGCAYRSFQTIFSWFRHQGYTNKPVPNHKEIQECLVKIGDKSKSFIGSKIWIGSTEISFCLDDMLGVTSMILSVSSGDEIVQLASQLENHFMMNKTPVMIGGGNLAHTILGINFNEETGNIKYLILDPHYISPKDKEDLNHIQSKGGIFWSGSDFWKKNCFYNLCLPQTPSCY